MITVLIDNGHGKNTPGKHSPLKQNGTRLYEWEHTRKLAMSLYYILNQVQGVQAKIITPEQEDISLKTRVNRINKICKEVGNANAIMISIHLDAAGNKDKWMSARGFSVWTTRGKTNSDNLAECIYDAADEIFLKDNLLMQSFKGNTKQKPIRIDTSDDDRDKEADFYITKNSNCPAVLVECFFQDNKEDVEYLESQNGFDNVVKVLGLGIKKYIEKYKK